jgi:SAM-dependent methyltransferase
MKRIVTFIVAFVVFLAGGKEKHPKVASTPLADANSQSRTAVKVPLPDTNNRQVKIEITETTDVNEIVEDDLFRGFTEFSEANQVSGVKGDRAPDVIFVPTPQNAVDKMLELAEVKKDDLVYDLGCGDGRIVVTAAKKYGCNAVGYDIDRRRIKESLDNVEKNGVGHLVRIEQQDIFTLDLSDANVVTLFLLPDLNVKLIPQLEKLKPGSRIVSYSYATEGLIPDKVVTVTGNDGRVEYTIYLWTVPLKKEQPQKKRNW